MQQFLPETKAARLSPCLFISEKKVVPYVWVFFAHTKEKFCPSLCRIFQRLVDADKLFWTASAVVQAWCRVGVNWLILMAIVFLTDKNGFSC